MCCASTLRSTPSARPWSARRSAAPASRPPMSSRASSPGSACPPACAMSGSRRSSSTASPNFRCTTAGSTPTRARSPARRSSANCSTRRGRVYIFTSICIYASMRTTVDIPDELLRRAKSEAALRGRKLKDLIEEGLRLMVDQPPGGDEAGKPVAAKPKPSAHDLLKDLIFDDDCPADLATNPKYFDDFGR